MFLFFNKKKKKRITNMISAAKNRRVDNLIYIKFFPLIQV